MSKNYDLGTFEKTVIEDLSKGILDFKRKKYFLHKIESFCVILLLIWPRIVGGG